jgi:hypothetical protein
LASGLSAAGLPRQYISCRRRRDKRTATRLKKRPGRCRFDGLSIVVGAAAAFFGRPRSTRMERRRGMPDFILLLRRPAGPLPAFTAQQLAALTSDYRGWGVRMRAEGRLKAGEKLTGDAGRVLTAEAGRVMVTDGPYAESKELLAGFYIIAAKDYGEASRIAEGCPHLKYGGYIELRQIDVV